jgi:hypothetical protein
MIYCMIEVIGGGGGGGGAGVVAGGNPAASGGGGSGGYAKGLFSSSTIGLSQAVTIGAMGDGGAAGANNGMNGGTTSVGTLINATGGSGGIGNALNTAGVSLGGVGGVGSGGFIHVNGNAGGTGLGYFSTNIDFSFGGFGGSSFVGGSPVQTAVAVPSGSSGSSFLAGKSATSYGAGGNGAAAISAGSGTAAGGNGACGVVIITEYVATGVTELRPQSNTLVDISTRLSALETLTGTTTLVSSINSALAVRGNSSLATTINQQGNLIGQMSGLTGSTALVATINQLNTTVGQLSSLTGNSQLTNTLVELSTTLGIQTIQINALQASNSTVQMATSALNCLLSSNPSSRLAALESAPDVHTIGDPTSGLGSVFYSPWHAYADTLQYPPSFSKVGSRVQLSGLFTGGSVHAYNPVFRLPVGYAPPYIRMFAAVATHQSVWEHSSS